MLDPIIVQILLGIGFIFYPLNILYVFISKQLKLKRKTIKTTVHKESEKHRKVNKIAIIGILALDIFILITVFNIFFFNIIVDSIPRIKVFFLTESVQIMGFFFLLLGGLVLFISYRELGENWTAPVQTDYKLHLEKEHLLVQTGIYKFIRHPIYDAMYIIVIGVNFLILDWLTLFVSIIGVIGLYYQAIEEEKSLIDEFGEMYINYMKNTGRILPKIL